MRHSPQRVETASGRAAVKTFSYDLHVHSFPRSTCARAPAEAMCRAAVEAGLTGIALTEHNVWWRPEELEELRRQFPELTILGGMEVTGIEHHFLVFLPEVSDEDFWLIPDVTEMVDTVHELGGIVAWAHPFRFHDEVPDWLMDARLDGIEVESTHMDSDSTSLALGIARKLGLFKMFNTDAHNVDALGLYSNTLTTRLENEADLIARVLER